MKSYVSLERAKSVDKDALIDSAFKKFNKQNVIRTATISSPVI